LGVRKLVSRNQIRQADFYPQARFMKAKVDAAFDVRVGVMRVLRGAVIQPKMAARAL
jgi:hypothetical protein